MANSLFKLLSTLALGVVAVQSAAISGKSAPAVRAQDASRPTRVTSSPTRVEVTAPESTIGESVYITSDIPLNDVMDEGSVYTITWTENSRTDTFVLEVFSFVIEDDSVPIETTIISLPFQDLAYNWTVQAQPDRQSLDYVYRFGILYDPNNGVYFQQEYTRVFQINTDV
ncbi:hypothetical protein ONZ43_g1626 [Nemania bipapillata]|uniref:Uncharacterized protein n=1 Tax=Nemania bipapillata TaxID=110536 RepID=A0ACC2J3N1_9PEZI|nr:hypothetical protein ONZ43_g1626 [Nemania bipapillata]